MNFSTKKLKYELQICEVRARKAMLCLKPNHTKGKLVWKLGVHRAVVFLQQAHMFCPIFLPTIPPYIRPVISWVVTVRAHSASALTLLHQPTEGEPWRGREREQERERGKPCPTFHCQNSTKWTCGVRGRRKGLKVGGELGCVCDASRSYHIQIFWGSFERLLYKSFQVQLSSVFDRRGKRANHLYNI